MVTRTRGLLLLNIVVFLAFTAAASAEDSAQSKNVSYKIECRNFSKVQDENDDKKYLNYKTKITGTVSSNGAKTKITSDIKSFSTDGTEVHADREAESEDKNFILYSFKTTGKVVLKIPQKIFEIQKDENVDDSSKKKKKKRKRKKPSKSEQNKILQSKNFTGFLSTTDSDAPIRRLNVGCIASPAE